MRVYILAVFCLVGAVMARPEAGFPQQHGLPTQNVLYAAPQVTQQLPMEQNFLNFAAPPPPSPPHSVYGLPEVTLNNGKVEELQVPVAPEEQEIAMLPPQEDSYNTAYHQSSAPHATGYSYPEQTRVHKHIYVHVPPKDFEEEDVIQPRVVHQGGPKMKHYKIVFIKAPAAPVVRPPVIPPPQQNEEKTLIYVLHKKPEAGQDIVIPTAAPTKPSKPEVFFIKYKTKKEEAPVYGPPPQQQQLQQQVAAPVGPPAVDVEPRFNEPSIEYGAPLADTEMPQMKIAELLPPIENPSIIDGEQSSNIVGDIPAQAFDATATMAAPIEEQPAAQVLDAPITSMAPIVVEEPRIPANNYGPPNRFFLKKKK